jgi:hypothetical protein
MLFSRIKILIHHCNIAFNGVKVDRTGLYNKLGYQTPAKIFFTSSILPASMGSCIKRNGNKKMTGNTNNT